MEIQSNRFWQPSGIEDVEELIRSFHIRYDRPIFWTETSMSGTVEEQLRRLRVSLSLVRRLRAEGLPIVGYTWWLFFSPVDWSYRAGEKFVEEYLEYMGIHDMEPDGMGNV